MTIDERIRAVVAGTKIVPVPLDPNMDGAEGERHPELGAAIAGRLLGPEYRALVLYHSRHYAQRVGIAPSRLCYADKASILYDPWWLYLPRARASGELAEYRAEAAALGFCPLSASDREWYRQPRPLPE